MVKTLQPGEGDDFSIEAEIDAFRSMVDAFDNDRRKIDSKPLGRLMLERDVFGKGVPLVPFELSTPYITLLGTQSSN